MRSFTDLIRSVGGEPGDSDLSVERTEALDDVAEALGIERGTPVGLIKRVRLIDGTPLSIANEYVRLAERGRFRSARGVLRRLALQVPARPLRDRAGPLERCHCRDRRQRVAGCAPQGSEGDAAAPACASRTTTSAGRPVLFAVNYHNSDIVQFTVTRAGLRA